MSDGIKKIKKELTWIERLVERSKEIIKINNTIHLLKETMFLAASCKTRPLNYSCLRNILEEYEQVKEELQVYNANELKAAYSHEFVIIADKFHITSAEMQAGCVFLKKTTPTKENKVVVLFLSDCTPDFLETIKAGELRELDDELTKIYLPKCKSVWSPTSKKDLLLERLKLLVKDA